MKIKRKIYSNITIFYSGDLSLLQEDCVSVSGSREIDNASSRWLRNKLNHISSPIVSGLAIGTDTIAHKTALKNEVPTVAVLPSGLRRITPEENISLANEIVDSGGLLISEYTPNTFASRDKYIKRNELIAILGKYLIVPQFNIRSGTRHTVDFAKKYSKSILVRNTRKYTGNSYIINDSSYKTII